LESVANAPKLWKRVALTLACITFGAGVAAQVVLLQCESNKSAGRVIACLTKPLAGQLLPATAFGVLLSHEDPGSLFSRPGVCFTRQCRYSRIGSLVFGIAYS
jgi:hypothetical protein